MVKFVYLFEIIYCQKINYFFNNFRSSIEVQHSNITILDFLNYPTKLGFSNLMI